MAKLWETEMANKFIVQNEQIALWDYSLFPSHFKDSFKMKEAFMIDPSLQLKAIIIIIKNTFVY